MNILNNISTLSIVDHDTNLLSISAPLDKEVRDKIIGIINLMPFSLEVIALVFDYANFIGERFYWLNQHSSECFNDSSITTVMKNMQVLILGGTMHKMIKNITQQLPNLAIIFIDGFPNGPCDSELLLFLQNPDKITKFGVSCTYLTHISMAAIAKLPNLMGLTLLNFKCKNNDLRIIMEQLPKLTALDLGKSNFLLSDLDWLAKLNDLTSLHLNFCDNLTDKAVENIMKKVGLKTLELDGCKTVTDNMLEKINNLTNLTELSYSYTDLTDRGLRIIANALPQLTGLFINGCSNQVSNDGVTVISKLLNLTRLTLGSYQMTCDTWIAKLHNLQVLKLTSCEQLTSITMENYLHLRELELRNCNSIETVTVINLPSLTLFSIYNCRKITDIVLKDLPKISMIYLDANCRNIKEFNIVNLPSAVEIILN